MTLQENAYSAFMLDHAAGALSRAEALVAELHRRLSPEGAAAAALLEAAGGVLLEAGPPEPTAIPLRQPALDSLATGRAGSELDIFLNGDLLGLDWRKTFFGVQTLPTPVRRTRLLRLDPGERAPQHGHGVRDVTVVLRGAFADEFGVYKRGDLAFAEPGVKHGPSAVGGEPCVCLIAAEPGPLVSEWMEAITWAGFPAKTRRPS